MEQKKDGFRGERAIILPQPLTEQLAQNEITRLLHITDIGYYPEAAGHFRERKQGAMQNILIYCTDGEGRFEVEGKAYRVSREQFFIIEAGKSHLYTAAPHCPWSIYWLHFTGDMSSLFRPHYNRPYTLDATQHDDRIRLFEEIYRHLDTGYQIDHLQYAALCLWHLLGSFLCGPQLRDLHDLRPNDAVQRAIGFMKEHLEKRTTLKEIASHVGYSASHFGQLFLHKTGYSPLHYFNQLKIQHACSLLDFSDLKIKEIAYRLGFYDPYHFSKVFLKQMGESPRTYRNQRKG